MRVSGIFLALPPSSQSPIVAIRINTRTARISSVTSTATGVINGSRSARGAVIDSKPLAKVGNRRERASSVTGKSHDVGVVARKSARAFFARDNRNCSLRYRHDGPLLPT